MLTDLLAWRDLQPRRPEILYLRTAAGQEIDFMIETPRRLLPIEVKAASRAMPEGLPQQTPSWKGVSLPNVLPLEKFG